MNLYAPITIILADDHEIFRDGFRSLVQEETAINLVAEAADGYTLLTMVERFKPDVVLTDIKMPGLNGVEATEAITKKYPHIPVIALSMFNDDHLIIDMLAAGAKGFLLKDAGKKPIIEAIFSVHKNQPYYCHATSIKLARLTATDVYDPIRRERKMPLSKREQQVLELLCQEKRNSEIAPMLNISIRTVEGVRFKLHLKANATSLVGLYRFAVRYGICKEEPPE